MSAEVTQTNQSVKGGVEGELSALGDQYSTAPSLCRRRRRHSSAVISELRGFHQLAPFPGPALTPPCWSLHTQL